jgi:hypothetical protein
MDAGGHAIGLFTTNRWVTGETWYEADDVIGMIDRFRIDQPWPSAVNRWLAAMLQLFQPQIADLLRQRDAAIASWKLAHRDGNVFEDRALEILSQIPISVPGHIGAIGAHLNGVV